MDRHTLNASKGQRMGLPALASGAEEGGLAAEVLWHALVNNRVSRSCPKLTDTDLLARTLSEPEAATCTNKTS